MIVSTDASSLSSDSNAKTYVQGRNSFHKMRSTFASECPATLSFVARSSYDFPTATGTRNTEAQLVKAADNSARDERDFTSIVARTPSTGYMPTPSEVSNMGYRASCRI